MRNVARRGVGRSGSRSVHLLGVLLLLLAGFTRSSVQLAHALPANIDGDGDGYVDALETALGSDPAVQASTPESVARAGSCFDGEDNDGDAAVDDTDTGCTAPEPVESTFPGAGMDVFDSSLNLDDYDVDIGGGIHCLFDLSASGPVAVTRSAPAGTPAVIDVEIIAMQLTGVGSVVPGGNCIVPSGDYEITIVESATQASVGQVTDANADPALDFPADSFFDVFFDIVVQPGVVDFVVPGGPPGGPPGAPTRVENTINTIPPYHGGKNTLCYQVAGLAHEHCPKAPPDHYVCYKAKFAPKFAKREVTLVDQFDQAGVGTQNQVVKPTLFCTPASKNGEPLYEETGHLECYKIKGQKKERTVLVRNQFGLRTVTTKKSALLCLPTEKNDEGAPQQLDHFQCYKGKFPKVEKRDVTLVDQFGTVQTRAVKPQLLCNPTSKNGEPIHNPLNHLECYKIEPRPVKQTAAASNQFGDETVSTKKAVMVCLPSSKTESVTTTTTTVTVPDSTTTTIPGGIDLMLGYEHTNPGVSSTLCGKVTAPSMPGGSGTVGIDGPSPGNRTVQLNQNGVGRFQHTITQFGGYAVVVQVGELTTNGNINVGPTEVPCP
jgi:hypothetical protein